MEVLYWGNEMKQTWCTSNARSDHRYNDDERLKHTRYEPAMKRSLRLHNTIAGLWSSCKLCIFCCIVCFTEQINFNNNNN